MTDAGPESGPALPAPTGETVRPEEEPPTAAPADSPAAPRPGLIHAPPGRLVSLDAFRGFNILAMLLVNNAALDTATPRPLTHAAWNRGLYFADMVFPWFLLIVGTAIPFSFRSARRRGVPVWRYDLKVLMRVVGLVLLGCLIDSSFVRRPVFDLNVLQLIGLAYGMGSLLYELSPSRRLAVAAGLLLAHWAAIRFLPVPGSGAGHFGENDNLIYYVNRTYLQPVHLDGLLSVVPTTALVLLGTLVGDVLRSETPSARKVAQLVLGGLAAMAMGWLWSCDLAFNKPVWTASYVLYAGGWGVLLLSTLYLLVDLNGWRAWTFPFVVFGANALTAYVLPILVKAFILQQWQWKMPDGSLLPLQQALLHFCVVHAGRVGGGWCYTSGYILFWWLVLLPLYWRQVYWRL